MNRSLTIAALAALAIVTAGSNVAVARSTTLSPEDAVMCTYLELAHESSCEELEAVQAARQAAAAAAPGPAAPESTGSLRTRYSSDPENYEPQAVPVRR